MCEAETRNSTTSLLHLFSGAGSVHTCSVREESPAFLSVSGLMWRQGNTETTWNCCCGCCFMTYELNVDALSVDFSWCVIWFRLDCRPIYYPSILLLSNSRRLTFHIQSSANVNEHNIIVLSINLKTDGHNHKFPDSYVSSCCSRRQRGSRGAADSRVSTAPNVNVDINVNERSCDGQTADWRICQLFNSHSTAGTSASLACNLWTSRFMDCKVPL